MSFNFTNKYDFLPKMSIGDKLLEVVSTTKLLGVVISSDLKWHAHTEYTVKKARQRLWGLRRLSKLGAGTDPLLEQYHLVVHSIMEMGAPVFSGSLSKANIEDFEDVQKQAFKIILRGKYQNYDHSLKTLNENTLQERRNSISLKFAKKCTSHDKMKHLFKRMNNSQTRSETKFIEPMTNSARGFKGPINYLIRLINDNTVYIN